MIDRKNGLTYADSGVDIDAGNRLIDLIKPMVRATARAGADAEIGGFGGLFDLKAAGFKDPVLVAATDGVGTKVKIAIETGLHGDIGIDLVAMSVNDLVVQGAEPLFFLDYFACGKLEPEATAAIVAGIAEACARFASPMRSRALPTSPAADSPTTFRACCPSISVSGSTWRACRCCRSSNGWRRRGASPSSNCCAPSTAVSA